MLECLKITTTEVADLWVFGLSAESKFGAIKLQLPFARLGHCSSILVIIEFELKDRKPCHLALDKFLNLEFGFQL